MDKIEERKKELKEILQNLNENPDSEELKKNVIK